MTLSHLEILFYIIHYYYGLIILIQFNFYSGILKIIIPFFFINFFLQVLLRVLYFFLMEVLKDKVSVSKKVLIYGAGSAGQSLYQSFKDKDEYDIVAFIDDNPNLINTLIFSKY